METRILIPNGLRIIVTEAGLKSKERTVKPSKSQINAEEDNEEKPSSSSGHCETPYEQVETPFQASSTKHSLSGDDDDGDLKSWKKQYRGQHSSSSSSSSLSPSCSDSSSSENETEIQNFMKHSRKSSDSRIGSSSNPFEYKKPANNTRHQAKNEECGSKIEKEKGDDNHSHVKICVARTIEKGTVFTPNDGDVQVVHLKDIPAIPKDDIRYFFGCFETITPILVSSPPPSSSGSDPLISPASTTTIAASPPSPEEKGYKSGSGCNFVRLCNWIRFLRRSGTTRSTTLRSQPPPNFKVSSDSEDDADKNTSKHQFMDVSQGKDAFNKKLSVRSDGPNFSNDSSNTLSASTTANIIEAKNGSNIIARFINDRPVFEVTERLVPGTELIAYFDMNSILNHSSTNFPYSTQNLPRMTAPAAAATATTTPYPLGSISPPPAPYSSSACISSSSPSLLKTGSIKRERDEKDLLQQYQRRQLPVFHYSFQNNYAAGNNDTFKNTQDGNSFSLWHDDMRFSRKCKGDDGNKRENSVGGIADGPLDLSKLPAFSKDIQIQFHEPLKVGTPFDSPDSNDDDMGKRNSPPAAPIGKSGDSSLFSIRNVLKHQASGPSSKLFQPYSLEIGKKSAEREALLKALTAQSGSHIATGSLITPPSSSDDHLTSRNSVGLRPILRTRGRERSLLPCEVCGKAFDRPSLLKRHLRTHTGEKPHICDVCSKGFSTSSSLNTHRRIHSGEKPHQCPICGKRFTASSNLYYHRMTHNKEKPHKCMLCGKSFPTPGDLKSHQYVHSGSWPYTCPVCHRGFSKQTNLRNHLLLHSGMPSSASSDKSADKPHACQLCDKKFAQACNLRAHIKTHEESDPVTSSCCICKRTFHSTSDMLLNGTCRNCLLSLSSSSSSSKNNDACTRNQRESTSTSPITSSAPCMSTAAAAATVEKAKEGFASTYDVPSLLSQRIASSIGNASQQPLAPSVGHLGLPISQFSGLSLPGLSSALSFPANAANLHFPMNGNHAASNAADLFMNAAATATPTRNTFLEQIVEWNYRMAKESVGIGSLGFSIMQQKLLESRMLAAQLMNTHGFGMNGGIQDILGLRSAMASDGFNPLEAGEGKFMPR